MELDFQLLAERTLPKGPALNVLDLAVSVDDGPVALGVDGSACRHILVPIQGDADEAEDREAAGVQLLVRDLEGRGTQRYLDLYCTDTRFNRMFARLADDLVAELESAGGDASRTCRAVLSRWREMFRSAPASGLSRVEVIGLLAELQWLERLAKEDPTAAMDVWTGWSSDRIDFRGSGAALEVKATTQREGFSIRIHGIRQLDPPTEARLFLAAVRYEETASPSGDTLASVVGRLSDTGVDSVELLRRLAQIGYRAGIGGRHERARFEEIEHRLYEVDEFFPRISASNLTDGRLPDRVTDVEYSIELSGQPPTPEAPEVWPDTITLLLERPIG